MSECACIDISVCDYEEVSQKITAGKSNSPFVCCECEETFPAGTERELTECTYEDREKEIYETCPDCLSVIKAFFCDGYYFNQVWEDVDYHIEEIDGQISSKCLLSLTPRARDKMFKLIQDRWDILNETDDEDDE